MIYILIKQYRILSIFWINIAILSISEIKGNVDPIIKLGTHTYLMSKLIIGIKNKLIKLISFCNKSKKGAIKKGMI